MAYPAAMDKLVKELERLPGVGPRTAERLAYHLVGPGSTQAMTLARALEEAHRQVRPCGQCFHLSDQDPCAICTDEERDRSRLLIVEQPRDLEAMERAGWKGLYHVLTGSLTQQDGARAARNEELTLPGLRPRLDAPDLAEVVIGTSPDLEGDGNALYVTEFIEKVAGDRVKVSRLARGVPTGSAIEYTNPAVLAEAIQERRPLGREASG